MTDLSPLHVFLSQRLQDVQAVQSWVRDQAAETGETRHDLSPRQQVYDDYFGVVRRAGGVETVPYALGQVMLGLAQEFRQGTGLSIQDTDRLMDGLRAVLEAVDDE